MAGFSSAGGKWKKTIVVNNLEVL